MFVGITMLASLKSFGVPYLSPYIPMSDTSDTISSFFLRHIWKREKRPKFLKTKRPNMENDPAMKWRNHGSTR